MEECLCAAQDPVIIEQYITETVITETKDTKQTGKIKDIISTGDIKYLESIENLKLLEKSEIIIMAGARLFNQYKNNAAAKSKLERVKNGDENADTLVENSGIYDLYEITYTYIYESTSTYQHLYMYTYIYTYMNI
jgi:hypothetical protein